MKTLEELQSQAREMSVADGEAMVLQAERVGGTDARAGVSIGANPYPVLSPAWYAYRLGHEAVADDGEPE